MNQNKKVSAQVLVDIVGTGGALSVSYGAHMIYEPAGFIVLGALCVAYAFLASR